MIKTTNHLLSRLKLTDSKTVKLSNQPSLATNNSHTHTPAHTQIHTSTPDTIVPLQNEFQQRW